MIKIYSKELKEIFISSMTQAVDFNYQDGNPFFITLSDIPYLIFLKNLSPAYFKGSPDITRIQLPYMEIFNQAITDGTTMIALGYDSENDVYISWSPAKLFQRINTKNNVSLYSRVSIQQTAAKGGFISGILSTGETFVAFDRSLLPNYFKCINQLFPNDIAKSSISGQKMISQEIISEISDPTINAIIQPLLKESKILEAASICFDHCGSTFINMRFQDWISVAKNMHAKLIKE